LVLKISLRGYSSGFLARFSRETLLDLQSRARIRGGWRDKTQEEKEDVRLNNMYREKGEDISA
jgi:hypothetical protein